MLLKKSGIIILAITIFLSGCKKEESNDIYLVDYSYVSSYSAENIKLAIGLYSTLYPDISSVVTATEYDIKIYTVEYRTTFNGESIIASGLVSVPDNNGSFPLISFQNGTNSCNSNAPTVNPFNPLYSLLTMMAGNGYIMSVPDYIGFGSTDNLVHPYYHRETSNQVIEDMILAVDELVSNHLKAGTDGNLFLMGYSQGGWATMASLKDLEGDNITGMNIVAASCGAGAYDLMGFATELFDLETYSNPFYFPYFIEGRISNGLLSDPLGLFFNEPYASAIPSLFDGNYCNAEINDQLTLNIVELFTPALLSGFSDNNDFLPLRTSLSEASVEAWHASTPIMMAHSNGDESVPYNQSINFITALTDAGTSQSDILFIPFADLLHNDAILPWGIATINWFNSFNTGK